MSRTRFLLSTVALLLSMLVFFACAEITGGTEFSNFMTALSYGAAIFLGAHVGRIYP